MDKTKDTNVLKRNKYNCNHVKKDRMISGLFVNFELFKTLFLQNLSLWLIVSPGCDVSSSLDIYLYSFCTKIAAKMKQFKQICTLWYLLLYVRVKQADPEIMQFQTSRCRYNWPT